MRLPEQLALIAILATPVAAHSQAPQAIQSAGPLSAALLSAWQRASTNMPAAADSMPADKFSFKPTPGQMSFGEIIAHEAESNYMLCAAIAGGAPAHEASPGATGPKDALVAHLRKSFEFCGSVVGKLQESALADSVPFFGGRKATKARAAVAVVQDWADHYAQAAMYLRLNGILPPSARPRP